MTDPKAPELTLADLEGLERLRAPCAGRAVKLASGKQEHAYVSALLWLAPELLAAARRLLELESALEFMARTHVDCLWEDTEGTLRLAREFGWTPPGESK